MFMKKYLFLVAVVLFVCFANAQYSKRISLTVIAGLNTSHYNLPKDFSGTASIINKGSIQSFRAGVLANIPIAKSTYLQTGLLANGKGCKTQAFYYAYYSETATSKPIYLELPISIIHKINIYRSLKIITGAGMYAALGIGGKNTYDAVYGDIIPAFVSESKNIHFSNNPNTNTTGIYSSLRKIDLGFNFLGGLEFKNVQLYVNYGLGIQDVKPSTDQKEDMGKNRTLTYGIGYTFKL